jgi:hypothetical protein
MATQKQVKRLKTRLQKVLVRCERLQAKRERLERRKKATSDFQAGLISKTELRKRVPRSWLPLLY